jgi:hypothetical protein
MKTLHRIRQSAIGILIGTAILTGPVSAFDKGEKRDTLPIPESVGKTDPRTSRSFGFDNDVLVPGSRDQDYTYGLNLTFSGEGAEDHWASLHAPLEWLDKKIGVDKRVDNAIESHKIEYGLFGFTPENITLAEPQTDDRPYAGLVYISSTQERYQPAGEVSWQSTLTVGVLGLEIVGNLQRGVHSAIDSAEPRGWDNQISDGGELTARYSLARQHLLYRNGSGFEIKSTTLGSIGYLTEASWSLSMRAGKIHTPWVSFNPELTSYGEKAIPSDLGRVSEHYFWTGVSLKARAYNAFLQGQFRDSDVTYASDELNHGIVEAWAGYTVAIRSGYSFTYSIRGHTSELKDGAGDRNVIWGGLLITKSFH